MKPKFKSCVLITVRERDDRNFGSEFVLSDKTKKAVYLIKVDESVERVKERLSNQVNGEDERYGIYLTNGMMNIDVNTNGDIWDINEETMIYYRFSKADVKGLLEKGLELI